MEGRGVEEGDSGRAKKKKRPQHVRLTNVWAVAEYVQDCAGLLLQVVYGSGEQPLGEIAAHVPSRHCPSLFTMGPGSAYEHSCAQQKQTGIRPKMMFTGKEGGGVGVGVSHVS